MLRLVPYTVMISFGPGLSISSSLAIYVSPGRSVARYMFELTGLVTRRPSACRVELLHVFALLPWDPSSAHPRRRNLVSLGSRADCQTLGPLIRFDSSKSKAISALTADLLSVLTILNAVVCELCFSIPTVKDLILTPATSR
jgi:hypothetical protein